MSSLIVDAHQDLAWNAAAFGRDYTQSALTRRAQEAATDSLARKILGQTMLGLPEYLRGRIAVIFGTLFASPKRKQSGEWEERVCYRDAQEAHRIYQQQLDYYHRLADECPRFRLIGDQHDLEAVLATWEEPEAPRDPVPPDAHPADPDPHAPKPLPGPAHAQVGLVPLMEGADGIREPREAEAWMERGLRIVGLAWTGTRYAGGTREPGPLTPEGRRLVKTMSDLGLMLDLAHSSDESWFEALDLFEGVVMCTHANPRALLRNPAVPERHPTDSMIRRLAERGGVVGVVPYNRFLKADWRDGDNRADVPLTRVADAIDYICQLTGSAAHVGLGTDFDGGFGAETAPEGLDTVADLPKIGDLLRERGFSAIDVQAVLAENWLGVLRRGLP
ncbi:MAG: membrane dipeptidase [Anaerolineales bacterium]|nr:membrane dipeptidase [Anaerolineales bacterium]